MTNPADPHNGQPILNYGASLDTARGAVIMVHGRGATADSILGLAPALDQPDLAYLAPQAAGRTWYPNSFMAPVAGNEPWLSSALGSLSRLVEQLAAQFGRERVALLGFSQGACLALEFAARHPARYAGVVGLSGGLIGPDGMSRDYRPALAGTPVFIGCSDVDAHIPLRRVRETAEIMRTLGAAVTERIYPGMGHTVNDDEVAETRRILAAIPAR